MATRGPVEHWTAASVDMRRLEYFLAVVDHGGVGRAADALLVAQPSLSQAVKTLGREMGAALFVRSGRGLVLTDAGRALVSPARQLLADAAAARTAARRVAELEGGRLDLVTLPTLAVDPLTELAGRFRERHPRVGINILAPTDADDVGKQVRSGDCELGLTMLPYEQDGLQHRELAPQQFDVVLPPDAGPERRGGPASRGGPVGRAELGALPWVITPHGSSTRALLDQALADGGAAPRIAVETDDREAIVPLVLAGAGATLLPRSMAEHAAQRGALVRPVDPPLVRRVALVHRPGPLSAAATTFLTMARGPEPAEPAEPGAVSSAARSGR